MTAPQGKGRGTRSVTEASGDRQETRARVAALPTQQPRPDWFSDPALLPKHPPGWKPKAEEP